jgi:hypothetical protein
MSVVLKTTNEETRITSFDHTKMPIINDPVDLTNISKTSLGKLTPSSVIKTGVVFFTTFALYYVAKTTNILSRFGWKAKDLNSKKVENGEITKIKNKVNSLILRRELKTKNQNSIPSIDRIIQVNKDNEKIVKFEEIEIRDLSEVKEKNREMRRSIIVQNPIPNQKITVGQSFNLVIYGTSVFSSSNSMFLNATNIPPWLISLNLKPTFKGSYDVQNACGIAVSGNYAYLANFDSGLQIIDISNPSNPTFKGSYYTPYLIYGVAVSENYAYMVDVTSGLQIIDVTDPVNPTSKGSYYMPNSPCEISIFGNYAYVGILSSGLQILDVSDPANPTFKGSYSKSISAVGLAVFKDYAYVADSNSGLQVIDVSDPSNPTFKGSYHTSGKTEGVVVSGNYAYIVNSDPGLQIINITDPSNPTLKGSYDIPNAEGIAVSGDYVYVTHWKVAMGGIWIVDISDPSEPTFKGSYDIFSEALGIVFSGNYVYLANNDLGLQIVAPNLDKLKLSGRVNSVGTYGVDIKACNEAKECATDSFYIIAKNSSMIIDLTVVLVIISSITVVICSIANLCCLAITCGGIVRFIRYRDKKVLSGSSDEKTPIFSINSETDNTDKLEKRNI